MTRWVCPLCEREFGRARQSHECVPAGTVEETFAGARAWQLPIYEAVMAQLDELGPLHLDAVGVGVFVKRRRTLVELRPMARALAVYITLPRAMAHPRVTRTMRASAGRTVNVVRLTDPAQVDDELRAWLAEAYDTAD